MKNASSAMALEFDQISGSIFWTDRTNQAIWTSFWDGTNQRVSQCSKASDRREFGRAKPPNIYGEDCRKSGTISKIVPLILAGWSRDDLTEGRSALIAGC